MSYTKFAVRGAAIVFVVSIGAAFLGFLVRLILSKELSLEEFGLFYSVYAFLGLLTVLKTLGFDRAPAKFIPEFLHLGKHGSIKATIIYAALVHLFTNIIITLFVFLSAGYLSQSFFHDLSAGALLKVMMVSFFIDSFVIVIKYCFQGFQKMVLFSSIDLIRMSLTAIFLLISFRYFDGVLVPAVVYAFVPLLLLITYAPLFLKRVFPGFLPTKPEFSKSLFMKVFKYSIFVMATALGTVVLNYTDTLVLTYFRSLEEVGLYNVAAPISKVLTYFPLAIMGVLIPLSSELWAKKRPDILKAGIESLYKYSIIFILPIVLAIFSFSELVISLTFGANFLPASNSLRILSLGIVFSTLYGVNVAFFSGIGKPEITSTIVYSGAIFNLIADLLLIPIMGMEGAAIATTISFLIMMSIGLFKMKKIISVQFPSSDWLRSAIAGIAFILSILILKNLLSFGAWTEAAIVIISSGIIYSLALFALNVVSIKELKGILKRII